MKKIILSLAAVLAFALTSDAQTRKGTVLLGAGSSLTESGWMDLQITPKVGYFVQDGVAVGAMINFSNNNVDKTDYELSNSESSIGVFARYYVSNNLFSEVGLSSVSKSDELYGDIKSVGTNNGNQVEVTDTRVIEESTSSMDINLGVGYTIVWREHFAIEPFVNLVFSNGEVKSYDVANSKVTSDDVKGTNFDLGVNFSLFF
ncbi:MAG: autotransporter domain-containing protein [Flavobacteriales bacterium]|nr:autotransporter domain-containing protein [Flavobacteriales bacterium]